MSALISRLYSVRIFTLFFSKTLLMIAASLLRWEGPKKLKENWKMHECLNDCTVTFRMFCLNYACIYFCDLEGQFGE